MVLDKKPNSHYFNSVPCSEDRLVSDLLLDLLKDLTVYGEPNRSESQLTSAEYSPIVVFVKVFRGFNAIIGITLLCHYEVWQPEQSRWRSTTWGKGVVYNEMLCECIPSCWVRY